MSNNLCAVNLLLEKCIEAKSMKPIEATDSGLQTALHKASKEGHKDVVRVLLQYGADETAEDMYGRTPLELAKEYNHDEIYQLLDTKSLILQLLPDTSQELLDNCVDKLCAKDLMRVVCLTKDCLRVRGDLGAILEFKAELQTMLLYKSCYEVQLRLPNGHAVELPAEWDIIDLKEGVKRVKLDKDRDKVEYDKIKDAFGATVKSVQIIAIERIQNPALYLQYAAKKYTMEQKCADCEKLLYHGTTKEAIEKINVQGFNRCFAGQNAAVYGNGVYFAVKASYSAGATYSKPDSEGHKHIYVCLVLTGSYTAGKQGMKVPPPKDPENEAVLFDSVVDKTTDPSMFIVFHDSQAYPKYLITFKEAASN
eukprot:Em0024g275a